jgi:hypothetical protein
VQRDERLAREHRVVLPHLPQQAGQVGRGRDPREPPVADAEQPVHARVLQHAAALADPHPPAYDDDVAVRPDARAGRLDALALLREPLELRAVLGRAAEPAAVGRVRRPARVVVREGEHARDALPLEDVPDPTHEPFRLRVAHHGQPMRFRKSFGGA